MLERRCEVYLSKFAEKRLAKLPRHVQEAYFVWVRAVTLEGLQVVRKIPGYHDEPLKGDRKGQRSVRLSKAYRVIYEETEKNEITLIGIMEVSKHGY